ncbi:MAG: hypothetical protein RJA44_322 [Pseudomonadota bacterium]
MTDAPNNDQTVLAAAPAAVAASAPDVAAPDADPNRPRTEEEIEAAHAAAEAAAAEAAAREAQIRRLLDRITEHPDFPSLKESIRVIQSLARSETAHMRHFSNQIMQDVAMSAKLLRLINTAFYASVGGGEITSIERAIALVGFKSIGTLASSIKMFDRLPKGGPHLERVRNHFARGLLAGMLSNQILGSPKLDDVTYTATVFQQLGEMLTWMHFPDDAAKIAALLAQDPPPEVALPDATPTQLAELRAAREERASRAVLGLSYDELGQEVSRMWGWPEELQKALRPLYPSDPERPASDGEYMRQMSTACNELAGELMELPPEEWAERLPGFVKTWGIPLGVEVDALQPAVEVAFQHWHKMAPALSVAKLPGGQGKPGSASKTPPKRPASDPRPEATPLLLQGIEDMSKVTSGDLPILQVLQLSMQTLRKALQLRRVITCLTDESGQLLQGRLGIGEHGQQLAQTFRIPLSGKIDLFGMLCLRAADTLISDISDQTIAKHLPSWFTQRVQAPTFLVLPLTVKPKTGGLRVLGMIYGDCAEAGSLAVDDEQLHLLKMLRNQVVLAMQLRNGRSDAG